MPGPDGIILGFDPGGKNAFEWSVCGIAADGYLVRHKTGLADNAADAISRVIRVLPNNPNILAAGIDAPLFWSQNGNREVDDFLICHLKRIQFKSILSMIKVNSLRGAALVQGVLLGKYLSETWDTILITESHPKVLVHLLNCERRFPKGRNMVKCLTGDLRDYAQYGKCCLCGCKSEKIKESKEEAQKAHKRDATLAAISAWAMVHKPCGWQNLYELECQEQEGQPVQPFNTPVAYWMPKPTTTAG